MNFFEQQAKARKRSVFLVMMMLLATLLITLSVALLLLLFINGGELPFLNEKMSGRDWRIMINAGMTVFLLILFGSLLKHLQLQDGGQVVAQALGGHLVNPATQDPDERRLLNLVEEMALASGAAVPPVYLIEDTSINAFAAGYSPRDAVIGVTRGALNQLSRDELQGVIAHEFSHIFNGDMRLNIRLVALLHGLLIIGLSGRFLMNALRVSRFGNSRDSRGAAAIGLLGLALFILGSIGVLFGKIIKAAVSRQREFLADASAVQFTRNPQGIAGALSKIAGTGRGSELDTPNAETFSHLFFSNALTARFGGLLATHPPIDERIARIQGVKLSRSQRRQNTSSHHNHAAASGFAASSMPAQTPEDHIQTMGQPSDQQIEQAQQLHASLNPRLLEAAHEPWGARALIYGLLLSHQANTRQKQLDCLQKLAAEESQQALTPLLPLLPQITPEQRLALVEIAIPTLRYLTQEQYQRFSACMDALIQADGRLSLNEWTLSRLIIHHLKKPDRKSHNRSLKSLSTEIAELLSLIAWAGQLDTEHPPATRQQKAQQCFTAALEQLPFEQLTLLPPNQLRLKRLDPLLDQLAHLHPLQLPRLLKAVASCIQADGQITPEQAELFSLLGAALDCPLPPLAVTKAA